MTGPSGLELKNEKCSLGKCGQSKDNTKIRTGYWRDIVVRKRKTEFDYVTGESSRCAISWENLEELKEALS